MLSVSFQNADVKPDLKDKLRLKRFIPELFTANNCSLKSLTIVFCSDDYLLNLNRQFLQHDYFTDILTFDLSVDKFTIGEIYISTDRVKENAVKESVSYQKELQRIIFHGVLHLCGFGDKTARQKKEMTLHEDGAIEKFAQFHVKQ